VPIRRRYGYEEVAEFAEQISVRVAERAPQMATVERRLVLCN
jgi:DNA primase